MNQSPDISIITVNYNGYANTCELIDSLERHIHSYTYEIIVVDNGSSVNEAQLLQKKFPGHTILRSEKNLGFAGGNNLGIHIARGKYLLLLNNDTYVKDDSLHFLCDVLNNSPAIGAVSPKIKFATPPYNIQFAGFTPLTKYSLRNRTIGYGQTDDGTFDTPHPTPFLHGAALLFRREILEKVGDMPEIYFLYYEELDWCSHILRHGYQLWYEPQCVIYHKESQATGNNSPLKVYYLTRNRLLYTWRNRKGVSKIIALLYQFGIANPKNIIVNLLKRKYPQTNAILKGTVSFFLLRNKMC